MPGPIRKPLFHPRIGVRIDAEAVSLFRHGLQLHRRRHRSADDRRAYSAAASRLDRALGIKLWATSVLDTVGVAEPPVWMDGAYELSCWRGSKQVEQQLRQALAAQRARVSVVPTSTPPEPMLP
jgi:hypothetical protein